jgi:hypothetical protein
MVLPGVQALLGFGFAATLTAAFERLPPASRVVHLAGVASIALAMVLLMAPAARHRLVERGEFTEAFHRFASRSLLAALPAMAVGVALQLAVVVYKATEAVGIAVGAAVSSLVLSLGVWFGLVPWLGHRDAAVSADLEKRPAA